jgi:hypothetical protein
VNLDHQLFEIRGALELVGPARECKARVGDAPVLSVDLGADQTARDEAAHPIGQHPSLLDPRDDANPMQLLGQQRIRVGIFATGGEKHKPLCYFDGRLNDWRALVVERQTDDCIWKYHCTIKNDQR